MKNSRTESGFTLLQVLIVVAIIGLLATAVQKLMADSIPISSTLAAGTFAGTAIGDTTGGEYQIPPDKDLGLLISTTATNNGTSNNLFGFNFKVGTNWTTTCPLQLITTNNGSNTVVSYVRMVRTNFTGVSALRFDAFSTVQSNKVIPNYIFPDYLH